MSFYTVEIDSLTDMKVKGTIFYTYVKRVWFIEEIVLT